MMWKSEDDDGYCSRSSLDSPVHSLRVETIPGLSSSQDFKEEEHSKKNASSQQSYSVPSFLEVMLTRDDWKKPDSQGNAGSIASGVSVQISQSKLIVDRADILTRVPVEKTSEKMFQPRKTIKLMPSSSQNLLLFTKQSALSGLVVSSKPNIGPNPVTFHSLIKNNHNVSLNNNISSNLIVQSQQTNRRISQMSQPVKLTAADVFKSKIDQQANISDTQKKLQASKLAQCHAKKVVSGKESNFQGSNSSFTSARTGQPYIRNSKGWGSRSSPYIGRHELHPVIDHDYCEFSAFNAEIQSGIILMSRETCARTDRMNTKRNKAHLQSPNLSALALMPQSSSSFTRNADTRILSNHPPPRISQSQHTENKRKYLKRKYVGPPTDAPTSPVVKNAVGRPRLSGKSEKNQVTTRRSTGYDSSDDLTSPPLTEDKNYVKIPGSFQNDFVYYATIRGRSSRKRYSEKQSTASVQQKNSSNIKAFEWYKEMANTDKSSRFGAKQNNHSKPEDTNVKQMNAKLDISNLFSFDEAKNLISESEVADLVMQMLPVSEVERNPLFHAQFLAPSDSARSTNIIGSDSTQSLIDGIIDIGNIDLTSMASDLGSMLNTDQRHDSVQDQQDLHSIDFPSMTSQLLEDICENDLLMSTDIANMNAFLSDFTDDQADICDAVESDVMSLLVSPNTKILEEESIRPACLTPSDSTNISSGDLSFSCDLKEFGLGDVDDNQIDEDSCCDVTGPGNDLSTLLTPPPSLSPSSAPPDLTTVNMFWNDLPGLSIEGREYVRLVDIHKQIMPAKDTGILKKRCIMLGLEVSSCSELQRDFLIRYMNAAKSKSKVIVTKETALTLIGFYVNPKMRSTLMAEKESKAQRSIERITSENVEVAKNIPTPGMASLLKDRRSIQMPIRNESCMRTSPEQIKRSARLLNKRFSYLDMVNNGLPVSTRTPKISSKHNNHSHEHEAPVEEDLQQRWLELLKKKISENTDDACSDLTEESDSSMEPYPEEEGSNLDECRPSIRPMNNIRQENDVGMMHDDVGEDASGEIHSDTPDLLPLESHENKCDVSLSLSISRDLDKFPEEIDSNIFSEFSHKQSTVVSKSNKELYSDNICLVTSSLEYCDSFDSMNSGELPDKSDYSSRHKSERVLRSNTCPLSMESTILAAKNDSSESRKPDAVVVTKKQCVKLVDESSNENRSPRVIRSKRRFIRPLSSSNIHRRQANKPMCKEVLSLNVGRMLPDVLQSRPHRQARRKFDVLKF